MLHVNYKGKLWDAYSLTCDCNKSIEMSVPKLCNKKNNMYILDKKIDAGEIDFLCDYLHYVTSMEQTRTWSKYDCNIWQMDLRCGVS